jgi:hypothetical protein
MDELHAEGYVCWFPQVPRNVYAPQKDIFGIFDVVSARKNGGLPCGKPVRWIQLTTDNGGNVSFRVHKIIDFFRRNNLFIQNSEVWGYKKDKHIFRKVEITYADVFPADQPASSLLPHPSPAKP